MTATESLKQEERRLVSLTTTLVRQGVLPVSYRTPRRQVAQAKALQEAFAPLLGGVAASLVSQLDAGLTIPSNEVQVDGLLLADNELVRDGLREAYLDAYSEAAREAFKRQAAAILDRAGIEVTWQQVESRARQVLQELSFQASQRLMERITGDVKGALLRGVDEGLSTREIGNLLRDEIQDLSAKQAEGIARTEVNSAANRGNYLAMEEAQVEFVQWIAAQDARTRPTHLAHHALVVRRGERFPNGLHHPGDREGTPISEWVGCRCAGAAYFPLRSEFGQATPFVGRA